MSNIKQEKSYSMFDEVKTKCSTCGYETIETFTGKIRPCLNCGGMCIVIEITGAMGFAGDTDHNA